MNAGPAQLVLALPAGRRFSLRGFLGAPSNEAARRWLARPQGWAAGRLVLWGPQGCGKTHLSAAWADPWQPGRLHADAAAAPLPTPAQLRGMTRIAIDNADQASDEPALLHLLNLAAEDAALVLLTARAAPRHWDLRLPDLRSRLLAASTVPIAAAEDELLAALLAALLADRQLSVPALVQDWMRLRLPRDAAALAAAVRRLDAASLQRQVPITRALARLALPELAGGEPESAPPPDQPTLLPDPVPSDPARRWPPPAPPV